MQMLLDEIVRASGQIIIVSAIPFIFWIFAARKRQSFFSWIGLKRIAVSQRGKFIAGVAAAAAVAVAMSPILDTLLSDGIQLANVRFSGKGFFALPGAVVFLSSLPHYQRKYYFAVF
jgi:hypothetical protein